MIKVTFSENYAVNTDGTFLGLVEAIADEWNREDWKEVVAACKAVSEGGDAKDFEVKWGVRFDRS